MVPPNELNLIIERIASGKQTAADIETLRCALTDRKQDVLQLGKYNVNIGQGQNVQIGDINYPELDDAAIQMIAQLLSQGLQNPEPLKPTVTQLVNELAPASRVRTPQVRPILLPSIPLTRRQLIYVGTFISASAVFLGRGVLHRRKDRISPDREAKPILKQEVKIPKVFEFDVVTVNAQGEPLMKKRHQAKYYIEYLGNDISLELVLIPEGSFQIGSPSNEEERAPDDEGPQLEVRIQSFLMGKFQVTQSQWKAVVSLPKVERELDTASSRFKGENHPIERISWYDAVEFCARLSRQTAHEYRLPSEAEWEYACRAGTTTAFSFGDTITTKLANYNGNFSYRQAPKGEYRGETVSVGSFNPNPFGLYDMHGNVWEWCLDHVHESYRGAPTDGSAWATVSDDSNVRLQRGGSWNSKPKQCRSANRYSSELNKRDKEFGFRVVCSTLGAEN